MSSDTNPSGAAAGGDTSNRPTPSDFKVSRAFGSNTVTMKDTDREYTSSISSDMSPQVFRIVAKPATLVDAELHHFLLCYLEHAGRAAEKIFDNLPLLIVDERRSMFHQRQKEKMRTQQKRRAKDHLGKLRPPTLGPVENNNRSVGEEGRRAVKDCARRRLERLLEVIVHRVNPGRPVP